jgi:putative hydroxymethylpyrimidine transport system substrate-binding protein
LNLAKRHESLHPLVSVALSTAVTALAALTVAACGSSSASTATTSHLAATALKQPTSVTLVLDYIPNAIHAGIYRAIAAGYYKGENIDLHVIEPTSTSDTLKLIDAGKAQFGLADGIDVADQIDLGRDAKAVMAITQLPLGAPIALASEHLTSPRQLEGKTVGITGVPSDTAVLDTVVRHAAGDPSKVHVITIGFNGARDLLAHRIDAFMGYWPADGIQLQVNGHPITAFKLDRNGGPAYPGLVAFTTEPLINSDPNLIRAFVAATVHGYEDTIRDPQRSLDDLLRLNPTIERSLARASLAAYLPLFTNHGSVPFGTLRPGKLADLSRWLMQYKLISRPIRPSRFGTNEFLPSSR